MNKLMMIVLASFLSSSAFAKTARTIECTGNDTEEWTIRGDFGGDEIEFFDNNTWSVFTHTMDLESFPVQMVYEEIGSKTHATITIRGTADETQTKTTATYTDDGRNSEQFTCSIQ